MKRLIIIAIALLGSILAAKAQDVIKTRSGEDILAKVSEVTPYSIKYKRFSNLDGPTYTMDIVNVIMIQYENGEKDVFDRALAQGLNSPDPVPEGLRYRDYRKLYNSKRYISQFDDKYSPGWSGVASFVIPGLGQAIDGEWGRAAGFFLGSVLLSSIARAGVTTKTTSTTSTGVDYDISTTAAMFGLASLALDIWSICDAVHVAKVKNMYYQDLRAQRYGAGLDVRLEPFLASTPSPARSGFTPAAGLSFKVTLPYK